jgi:hypothetical protein
MSWVSLNETPASTGENAQKTPMTVATAETPDSSHSGWAWATARIPANTKNEAAAEPRASMGTRRARPRSRSRAPRSTRRSRRKRKVTSAISRSTSGPRGTRPRR